MQTVRLEAGSGKIAVLGNRRPLKGIVFKKVMIPKHSSDGTTSMYPVLVRTTLAPQKSEDDDHAEEVQVLSFSDDEQDLSQGEEANDKDQVIMTISSKKVWTKLETIALLTSVLKVTGNGGSQIIKDDKFWKKVADELNKAVSTPVNPKQAKWKYDKISGTYKRQKEWDCKSGSEPYAQLHKDALDDELFNLMADIKGHPKKSAGETNTLKWQSSSPSKSQSPQGQSEELQRQSSTEVDFQTQGTPVERFHSAFVRKKGRGKPHGSGSRLAASNYELSQQFIAHLESVSEITLKKVHFMEKSLELREMYTKCYSQYLEEERQKELQRKEDFELKLKERNRRHAEKMEIERERNRIEEQRNALLERLLLDRM